MPDFYHTQIRHFPLASRRASTTVLCSRFLFFPQTQREGKKCFEFVARTSNEHRAADRRNVIPLSANRPKSRASGFHRKQGGSSLEKKCCLSSNTSCVRDREEGCYVFVELRERERERVKQQDASFVWSLREAEHEDASIESSFYVYKHLM